MSSSVAAVRSADQAQPRRSGWFLNPWFDSVLIIGTPLLVWPLIMGAQEVWSTALLVKLIFLSATGHYFATFARTYGDLRLFRRFPVRFTLVPALLLVTCIWAFTTDRNGERVGPLLLMVTGWAWWHWLAQAFGFARIYDAKIGSFRPLTAWLDKALVVTWFLGAIVLSENATANFCQLFISGGIALPGAAFFEALRSVVFVVVLVVTAAYAGNVIATLVHGERVSWIKQLCHFTTIGFYWFAFGYMPNFFVSYVLYELFHDIQYFAIVWLSCRMRVQRPGVTAWMSRMFRPGARGVFLFLGVMLAFGATDTWTKVVYGGFTERITETAGQVWIGLFLTAALLHYYFDGFIWKVRESDLRNDLGMGGGVAERIGRRMRHAAAWGLFFVPLAFLWFHASAAPAKPSELEQARMIVTAAPGSFEAQAKYAYALIDTGDVEGALEHYRRSVEINPRWVKSRFNYGAALDFAGSVEEAAEQYRAALQCREDDQQPAHPGAHVNLGVLLYTSGDRSGAQEHFATGRRLGGQLPAERMLGLASVLAQHGRVTRATALVDAALRIDPGNRAARHLREQIR